MSLAPDLPPVKRLTLKAGKRDTVASIARRYRLPVAQVAQWNKVGSSARFKRHQAIVVYVPVGSKLATLAKASPRAKKGRQLNRNTKVAAKGKASTRSKRDTATASNTRNKRIRVAMAPH